jgi:Trk K+ transport system NAD-binding subunit
MDAFVHIIGGGRIVEEGDHLTVLGERGTVEDVARFLHPELDI